MKIKRTLDTTKATYDLLDLTDEEFTFLVRSYEHYSFYIRHCPPADEDNLWNKMKKMSDERITII